MNLAAAIALATGCGDGDRAARAPVAPAGSPSGAAGLAAERAALTAEESAQAAAQHDQFASAGLACASCHPCGASPVHGLAWMDEASPGFHAYGANGGLVTCQGCHGDALDGVGGSTSVSCAACHGAGWESRCTMCHGGVDDPTGAPPRTTWGNGADAVRVGAHASHVGATHGLAVAIDCAACHVKPADAFAPGHLDASPAEVVFAGLASQGVTAAPTWTRASATCAGTYCHGATLSGGAQTSPVWTVTDGTQRACTSCHGAPPPSPHPQNTSCGGCHGAGYGLTSVDPATHVNGTVDVGAMTCASCHGDPARQATPLNPQIAAAPPQGTHGETATTARAVGAHQQHLAGGTLSDGVACDECHAVPTSLLHSDGTVALAWGTLARTGGATPAWSAASATCSSNWCHGAKLTGGSDTTPIWTRVDGTQDACGTCHGRPPSSGQHGRSEHRVSCGYCHAANYTTSAVDPALHVDGLLQVQGTRIRSWNPTTKSCWPTCHGTESWNH